MSLRRLLPGFAVFALLSAAGVANILLLQPQAGLRPPPARAPEPMRAVPAATVADAGTSTPAAIARELETKGYLASGSETRGGDILKAAILAYEHDHGLPLSAEASESLLRALILGGEAAPQRAVSALSPTAQQFMEQVAATLAQLGYRGDGGGADGIADLPARVRQFERAHRLPETGRISAPMYAALAKVSASRATRQKAPS
jgi:hypothetical protein